MDKKWWLLYCWVWKRNKEYEERVLLIVLVVIDCGVGTTVNTTILLMYILIYIMFNFCLLKNPWKSWWWWCVSNQSGTNLRICPRPCWIQWLKKIIYVLPKVFEKNGPKQYVRGGIPSFYWGTLYNWASRRDSDSCLSSIIIFSWNHYPILFFSFMYSILLFQNNFHLIANSSRRVDIHSLSYI